MKPGATEQTHLNGRATAQTMMELFGQMGKAAMQRAAVYKE
jgi:hypothetical protein